MHEARLIIHHTESPPANKQTNVLHLSTYNTYSLLHAGPGQVLVLVSTHQKVYNGIHRVLADHPRLPHPDIASNSLSPSLRMPREPSDVSGQDLPPGEGRWTVWLRLDFTQPHRHQRYSTVAVSFQLCCSSTSTEQSRAKFVAARAQL